MINILKYLPLIYLNHNKHKINFYLHKFVFSNNYLYFIPFDYKYFIPLQKEKSYFIK